jgi:sulfate adenylyltransferase
MVEDLVPVHGGLAEPTDRVVPLSRRRDFLAEAEKLPSLRVSRADLSTVYRLSDGGLSPLEGPMVAEEWHRVLDDKSIERGGRAYAWTIPMSLPVSDEEAAQIPRGGSPRSGTASSTTSPSSGAVAPTRGRFRCRCP